jgi:DNA-binding NtrC family response regulator
MLPSTIFTKTNTHTPKRFWYIDSKEALRGEPGSITDQRMPEMTGIELLKNTVALRPRMVRMILTGYTDVDALVEAINCGQVYRYVTKPWSNEELRLTVQRALEHFETNRERYELELANQRLRLRIREIQELATLEPQKLYSKDGAAPPHSTSGAKQQHLHNLFPPGQPAVIRKDQ